MKRFLVIVAGLALFSTACNGGGDGLSVSALGGGGDWCDRALAFDDSVNLLDQDDFPTPEDLRESFSAVRDDLDGLRDDAPSEIREDVELSLEGFGLLFDALDDADFNFFDIDIAAFEAIDDPKFETATDNVQQYLEDECGLEPDDDTVTDNGDDPFTDNSSDDDSVDDPVDSDDSDDSSGDDGDDEGDLFDQDLPTDGTVGDAIVDSLVDSGFTTDEAQCIANEIGGDLSAFATSDDPTAIFELFENCNIDIARLSEIGG